MLEKYLILVLLPTVVYSHIKINIKPNQQGTDASIDLFGEETTDISDKDREIFKINDADLKRASEEYVGKRCGDVYVKPPTPWGDVFQKHGWSVVKKTIKPIEAKIVGVNAKPVSFGAAEYVNNHDTINVTYSTSVSHQVEETVSHTWNQGGELGLGLKISYSVNFGAGSAGGSASMSYTSSWGEETSKSRVVTLGTTSTVLAVVPPKSMVRASLLASEGSMDIEVEYKVTLDGKVFCNYPGRYKGHYFYSMPVRSLQNSVDVPYTMYSTERISIGFYTTARIDVSNGISTK